MDLLGLPGEKPMMPPPPKVCPVTPVLDPKAELPLAPLASGGHPDPPIGVLEPKLEPEEPKLEPEEPKLELEEPKLEPEEPNMELELSPEEPGPDVLSPLMPQFCPIPPIVEPANGCPKNPIAVGALFWPNRMGLHSSFPVVGSMYFLRRKRILLVGLISASGLGG